MQALEFQNSKSFADNKLIVMIISVFEMVDNIVVEINMLILTIFYNIFKTSSTFHSILPS